MMTSEDISVDVTDRVARIVINRPQAMNALRRETFVAMRAAFVELASDRNVRAAIVSGSGRAFCAGADLSDPMMGNDLPAEERPAACRQTLDSLMNALIREIRNAPFPVVSAVNGVAAGGGVGLALAADMVVAARSARFLVTFTPKLGLVPDLGTSWHLARHLGRARALGLALTGEPLSADDAA